MKILFSMSLILLATGCTTIQSVSLTNYAPASGKPITGSETGWGILHLTTPSVDDMTGELLSKIQKFCPTGPITNIKTIFSVHELILAQMYDVQITANCVGR